MEHVQKKRQYRTPAVKVVEFKVEDGFTSPLRDGTFSGHENAHLETVDWNESTGDVTGYF